MPFAASKEQHRYGDQQTDDYGNYRSFKAKFASSEKVWARNFDREKTGGGMARYGNAQESLYGIPKKMEAYDKPNISPP